MEFTQEPIFLWLAQYAYQPSFVYLSIMAIMGLSSLGLPLPEEVTIISVGLLAFMATHPESFPPPYEGAPTVTTYWLALVTFCSAFVSDLIVYSFGRIFKNKFLDTDIKPKFISRKALNKAEALIQKYGSGACVFFRFTPGLRFPGHLACGSLGFPAWKFATIDGIAAAISVPTQIYLIAKYGDDILKGLQRFRVAALVVIAAATLFFTVKYLLRTAPKKTI